MSFSSLIILALKLRIRGLQGLKPLGSAQNGMCCNSLIAENSPLFEIQRIALVTADQSDRKTVGMHDIGQSILASCDHRARTIQGLD